jgi:hypothetical protein
MFDTLSEITVSPGEKFFGSPEFQSKNEVLSATGGMHIWLHMKPEENIRSNRRSND